VKHASKAIGGPNTAQPKAYVDETSDENDFCWIAFIELIHIFKGMKATDEEVENEVDGLTKELKIKIEGRIIEEVGVEV